MRGGLHLFAVGVGVASLGATSPLPATSWGSMPTGRVVGTVTLTSAVARPARVADYLPRTVRTSAGSGDEPEIRHVVVYVDGAPSPSDLPHGRADISQRDEIFRPRVVAVTRGSRVEFPNDDPFFHNVFSLSHAASFDLGRYEQGKSRGKTFDTPGIVKVFCDLHSYMSAVVFVFDHPYFVIPDEDGRFVMEAVPEGTYDVIAWHERIGDSRQPIAVEAGRTSDVAFMLPVLDS